MEQVGGPDSFYRPLQMSLEYLLLPRKIQAFYGSISSSTASNIRIVIGLSYSIQN